MNPPAEPSAEDLLAEALAAYDAGGETELARFVAQHPAHAAVLQRGIRRCRDMGLLGMPAQAQFPERLDDFRLLRRLGGGGMGVVYEAEQMQFGRRVALKVIRPELLFFEGARERFQREVDAIAKLSHPAIVPVLASGEHDGVPYFVMELLSGATAEEACAALRGRDPSELEGSALRGVVDRGGQTDETAEAFHGPWWQVCTRFAHQVALGMRHAHLRGIVHRDLKPSNVMLTPHGQAIVLDFGIAQVGTGRELTRSGATPGSPAFMSPEQIRGDSTDERTDVYSLAATLWQMLTLQRPFPDQRVHEHILQGNLPSLRARNRTVPSELELVLRTAMDRDRERRYRDMGAFADDLLAVLQRKPIAARPLGVSLRILRWCQRHKVTATALGAFLVGAAALPAALAWQQARANTALRAEQERTLRANEALREEQARTLAANEALRKEQERTRLSLDTSLDALQSVLVRLGNDRLRTVPLAEHVAHQALSDAAELYRKLLEHHPDHLRVRMQAGRALHALAMSFERQGKTDAALALAREAVDVLHGDRMDVPASVLDVRAPARMSIASSLSDRSAGPETRAAIEAAERDFVALGAFPGCEVAALRGRANLRTTRSVVIDENRDPAAAEAVLREAIDLQEEVVARGTTDPKDAMLRVTYRANLAKFLARRERDADARAEFERALALADELAPGTWPPPEVVAAEMLEGLGNLLARTDPAAAEPHLRACLERRERALAQFPDNLVFRVQLGGTLHNLALCLSRMTDRAEEALALLARAIACQRQALARSPGHRQSRLFLGNHLRLRGSLELRAEQGEALLATARELAGLDFDANTALAAAHCLLHARRLLGSHADTALLDEAMAQVLAAERHGLASARPLAEAVFVPLRARPEWAALHQRLRARAEGK